MILIRLINRINHIVTFYLPKIYTVVEVYCSYVYIEIAFKILLRERERENECVKSLKL